MTARAPLLAVAAVCLIPVAPRAQNVDQTPSVPKRLAAPRVNAICDDDAYADALRLPLGRASVVLVHSGLELFACFGAVPADARSVSLWLDPQGGRGQRGMGTAQVVVRAWPDGRVVARQGTAAETGPLARLDSAQVRAAGTASTIELAVPLAWLGGAGGLAALRVSVDGGGLGESLSEWPVPSDEARPSTWGLLSVGPPPVRPATPVGSAFVDGQGGYLTTPFIAALAARPVTFEAWVRVVDTDCGTLLGAGYERGYWIGICDVVRYRVPGGTWTRQGQAPLGKGWHHVGLTVDSGGVETLYLDGVVELRVGWRTAGEEARDRAAESAAVVAPPDVRIGADAEAPENDNSLHAYVSEIRIWETARSQAEIRRSAAARLTAREPGLVALWRFADGLTDLVAGRRAGAVGFASLAALARDSAPALRALQTAAPRVAPARPTIPAWDGRLPVIPDSVSVDGLCRPDEYENAAWIPLEPARRAVIQAALTDRALYVCTGVLLGTQDRSSTITLHLSRDGDGTDNLDIAVTGDGAVTIRPRDERTPERDSTRSITSAVVGRAKLDLQGDDVRPLAVPWWSAEVRIPISALRPFDLANPKLRLGVEYQAALQAGPAELRQVTRGRWPAALDPQTPATWGVVSVTREVLRPPTAIDFSRHSSFDPNDNDFYTACPTDEVSTASYVGFPTLKWPLVDPGNAIVRVEGVLTSAEFALQDSPFIHHTHDIDMHMTPRAEDRWLVLNADQGKTDLVLETESGRISARARPIPGDRVIAAGRWIFDCGHDPKTEVHPTPVFITDRLEHRPVRPDKPPFEVRVIRIWLKSNPSVFSYTFSGPVEFTAALPKGYHHYVTVVAADLPPTITRFGDSVTISVTPPATGQFYDEIVLGALDPWTTGVGEKAFTVSLDEIDVNNDHDSAAPELACSSVKVGVHDCGEWTLAVNLNGAGRTVWNRKDVSDADNPWTIGIKIPVAGGELRLHSSGYEDDDENFTKLTQNLEGDDIGQSGKSFWSMGSLTGMCCGTTQKFNAPGGDWQLRFRVFADAPELAVLPAASQAFWASRVVDELNDGYYFTALGTLTPKIGLPVTVLHDAAIFEAPFDSLGVRMLDEDEDHYTVTLGDFATLTAELLDVPSLKPTITGWGPWAYSLPPELSEAIGYKHADVRVSGTGTLGDRPYTLRVRAIYKILPPDWGEGADATPDGRIVDLQTPDAATEIVPKSKGPGGWTTAAYRRLVKDWAWQHVVGDVDFYTVLIPKVTLGTGEVMVLPCKYNTPATLELRADGERIVVPSQAMDSLGHLSMFGLSSKFPDGKVRVRIEAGPQSPRSLYRLQATYKEALFYSAEECAARTEMERQMRERFGTLTALPDEPPFGFSKPKPLPEGLVSPELSAGSAYTLLQLGEVGALDLVVSPEPGAAGVSQPAVARLYDLSGVLVAEGEVTAGAAGGGARGAQLVARGLGRNRGYVLQVIAPAASGVTVQTW